MKNRYIHMNENEDNTMTMITNMGEEEVTMIMPVNFDMLTELMAGMSQEIVDNANEQVTEIIGNTVVIPNSLEDL